MKAKSNVIKILVIISFLLIPVMVIAQGDESDKEKIEFSMSFTDLSIPNSPAFTAIGGTPSQIITPMSGRELGLALVPGMMGMDGRFNAGFGLEASPYALIAGDDMTLSDYQESYLTRFAYHATISAATLQSTDGGPTSASLGLKLRLVDLGDSRMNTDLIAKILKENNKYDELFSNIEKALKGDDADANNAKEAIKKELKKLNAEEKLGELLGKIEEYRKNRDRNVYNEAHAVFRGLLKPDDPRSLDKIREKVAQQTWNAFRLAVAGAVVGEQSPTDDADDDDDAAEDFETDFASAHGWMTAGGGFGDWDLFLLQVGYVYSEDEDFNQGEIPFGGRAQIGAAKYGLGAEVIGKLYLPNYHHNKTLTYEQKLVDEEWQSETYTVNGFLEVKIMKDTWIGISYGAQINEETETEQIFSLANIKWGTESARWLYGD